MQNLVLVLFLITCCLVQISISPKVILIKPQNKVTHTSSIDIHQETQVKKIELVKYKITLSLRPKLEIFDPIIKKSHYKSIQKYQHQGQAPPKKLV